MPPSEVADAVHDAIVDDTFWILTHDEAKPAITERARQIVEGINPTPTRLRLIGSRRAGKTTGHGRWAGLTERFRTMSRATAIAISAGTMTLAWPVYSATKTTPVSGTA